MPWVFKNLNLNLRGFARRQAHRTGRRINLAKRVVLKLAQINMTCQVPFYEESKMKVETTQNVQGSVLVVGGGIAGMQSALDLADSGYYVYLLEKKPSIGGVMSQLDKTFPTNDCAM